MDLSLVIFVVVTLFFVYRGYRNGLMKSLSRILGLVAGYVAVIFLIKPTTDYLHAQTGLDGLWPVILAALTLFIAANVLVSILFAFIRLLMHRNADSSKASAVGGAAIGLLTGVIVGTIAVWGLGYIRDMNNIGSDTNTAAPDSMIEKLAGQAAGKVVGSALRLTTDQPEIVNLGTALVEAPADIGLRIKRLSANSDLHELLQNPDNQAILNSGDVQAVQQIPAFRQLLQNEDIRSLVNSAGLTDANDSEPLNDAALAAKFSDIWRRVQKVRNNERLQAIINDADFKQRLSSNNPLELLGDGRVMELTDIIFSEQATPAETTPIASAEQQEQAKEPTPIYRWKDDKGRVFYSDKPQPE